MHPTKGHVNLKDKLTPICSRHEPLDDSFCYLLGKVDISAFKNKLLSLPLNQWDDEYQEGNVKLIRPAHDAWGIKKIIFTFCDDFLLKVIDLPWSQLEEWKIHLKMIYKAIGVDESKVVRCLLASMPPSVSIPIHHDTGYWVKHCHRVHVPIITDTNHVDFLVGPTADKMNKVLFEEGCIIELNNQAKHAVDNKWDKWRVHLIFDYVEDHPITRYQLRPGETVFQTRRSLDLERERGSRRAPSFIILGAQKCGTTSLYSLLCEHPLVVPGKRRETHYFDWRWNDKLPTPEKHHEYYINFFEKDVLTSMPSLITGESTPSYFLHSNLVIPRIKLVCPWAQMLIILRNPVDRAYSHYHMCTSTEGTPEQLKVRGMSVYGGRSFEDIVQAEIQELACHEVNADCAEDVYNEYLSKLPMGHGGHSLLLRGCYSLQLARWIEAFPSDQLKVLSIADIKGFAAISTMEEVYAFVGLPPHTVENIEAKNTRSYAPMSEHVRTTLERFYAPYNERLFKILGKSFDNW